MDPRDTSGFDPEIESGFFKAVKGTPFAMWDTVRYSRLCLLLSRPAPCLDVPGYHEW